MAETRKELVFALFDEGKRPSDPEVKALGLKSKTTYNYYQQWKKTSIEPEVTTPPEQKGSNSVKSSPPSRAGVPTTPVTVGKITITPENWGFTQYGAILVLDTYNKAKKDIDYSGTIGEFLCDICEFYRRILNYKEVEYDEGRGGTEEDGAEGARPVGQLTED